MPFSPTELDNLSSGQIKYLEDKYGKEFMYGDAKRPACTCTINTVCSWCSTEAAKAAYKAGVQAGRTNLAQQAYQGLTEEDIKPWTGNMSKEELEKARESLNNSIEASLYKPGTIFTSKGVYNRICDLTKEIGMEKLQTILKAFLDESGLTEEFLEFAKEWEEEQKDEQRKLELLGEDEEEEE